MKTQLNRSESVFVMVLIALSAVLSIGVPISQGYHVNHAQAAAPLPAASALNTYTTPLTLTWQQTFTSAIHIDVPPSRLTFYPNGTVMSASQTTFLKWTGAIIPLQTPTSFQANTSYVSYSMKGPATCVVDVSYKQSGNVALFGMTGSSCASSTFSINLVSHNPQLVAVNSTGGTTGNICSVFVGAIEWSWCAASLSNVAVSYSAASIKFTNSAQSWSFQDPIALDGAAGWSGSGSTVSITMSNANDVIVVAVFPYSSGSYNWPFSDSMGLTYTNRELYSGSNHNSYQVAYAVATSAGTDTITGPTGTVAWVAFAVSGVDTSSIWDANPSLPAVSGSNVTSGVSTSNADDMIIAFAGGCCGNPAGYLVSPSGYSNIAHSFPYESTYGSYSITTSTISSQTFTWGDYATVTYVDALQAAPTGTPTIDVHCIQSPAGATINDTVTLTGGSPSPSPSTVSCNGASGSATAVTVQAGTPITATVGTCTALTDCSFKFFPSGVFVTTLTSSCPAGTCTWTFHDYLELNHNYTYSTIGGGTPGSPTLSIYQGGNLTTFSLSSPPLTDLLADYSTSASITNPSPSSGAVTRWDDNAQQFASTTGNDLLNFTYYTQVNNTERFTPVNPTAWDGSHTLSVTGTQFGLSGQTLCSTSTSVGVGAVECAGWSDNGTKVTLENPIPVNSSEKWVNSCGPSGNSWTPIAGNQTFNCNYGRQWQVTFAVSGTGTTSPNGTAFYNDGYNGSTLAIAATPSSGSTFGSWSSTNAGITFLSDSAPSTNVTIDGAGTITALFTGGGGSSSGGGNGAPVGTAIPGFILANPSYACSVSNQVWNSLVEQLTFSVLFSGGSNPCTISISEGSYGQPYYAIIGGNIATEGNGWSLSGSTVLVTISQSAQVTLSWTPLKYVPSSSSTASSTRGVIPSVINEISPMTTESDLAWAAVIVAVVLVAVYIYRRD